MGIQSVVSVPLKVESHTIGTLALLSLKTWDISQGQLTFLELMAERVAHVIERSRLLESERQRTQELVQSEAALRRSEREARRLATASAVVAEIGRVISSSLDINEVYESLGEQIRKLIPFDRIGMSLVLNKEELASQTWESGTELLGGPTRAEVPLGGGIGDEAFRTKSPILLLVETPADFEHRFPLLIPAYDSGLRCFMAVPLIDRDAVIGVLRVASKNRSIYTQRHLELLERIGSQIAGAIANSQLYAQQKDAEERIRTSLNEKEVLLKEVHHRVKNNLQVISSLLNLQARNIDDELARDILRESRNRVRAMALIHEQLYQSEDLARIPFGVYIRKLTNDLYRTYQVDSDHVTVNITAGDLLVGIDTAIPCGLIINELVSNSLKHAFPAGAPGEIVICLEVDKEGNFVLTVSDNGVGIPDGLDLRNAESLGMQLVSSLVDQLGASLEIDGSRGTRFTIKFMHTMEEEEFI
ncbi:MAG: GAF domain-containing protein [Deltaproteobacteria bacterium]|nr:GAF domain-containing protein [Deltaproteobacteria bacterium]